MIAGGGLDRERVGVASSRGGAGTGPPRAPRCPDSSASDPSGLKIRRRATYPACSGSDRSRIPSAPTPVCGAQIARIRARASARTGALPPRRSRSRCRARATSRTPRGRAVYVYRRALQWLRGCTLGLRRRRCRSWLLARSVAGVARRAARAGSASRAARRAGLGDRPHAGLRRGLLRQRGARDRRDPAAATGRALRDRAARGRPELRASAAGQAVDGRRDRAVRRRAVRVAAAAASLLGIGRDPRDVRAGRSRRRAEPLARRWGRRR